MSDKTHYFVVGATQAIDGTIIYFVDDDVEQFSSSSPVFDGDWRKVSTPDELIFDNKARKGLTELFFPGAVGTTS